MMKYVVTIWLLGSFVGAVLVGPVGPFFPRFLWAVFISGCLISTLYCEYQWLTTKSRHQFFWFLAGAILGVLSVGVPAAILG
jgi:hypothetical protein